MLDTHNKQRTAACVEYCGVNYHGWQRQKNANTVQEEVEKAISKVANEPISIITAGRTDAGVHGIGQVIHFDSHCHRTNHQWIRGVNTYLPNDISLIWTHPVADHFHARFSAQERRYRYILLNRPTSPSFLHGRVSWHPVKLDEKAMQLAAEGLIGRHDFSAFRAAGCQSKDPVKTVRELRIERHGQWICLDIAADGFLHHMVRNIAGVLIRIGQGLESPQWATQVLRSADRKQGGVTAMPDGLYFVQVDYDDAYRLPNPPPVCEFW